MKVLKVLGLTFASLLVIILVLGVVAKNDPKFQARMEKERQESIEKENTEKLKVQAFADLYTDMFSQSVEVRKGLSVLGPDVDLKVSNEDGKFIVHFDGVPKTKQVLATYMASLLMCPTLKKNHNQHSIEVYFSDSESRKMACPEPR